MVAPPSKLDQPNSTVAYNGTIYDDGHVMVQKRGMAADISGKFYPDPFLLSFSFLLFSFSRRGSKGAKFMHRLLQ